ncbi:MAG: sigma-54 dependent transcriptional regulator, partial [Acidobacteriota bacterium]|nr:sigma-54 dependent transcriptional regulator [Acidobacteriota bacterium]
MPDSQAIKLCFITRDIGLADAVARALGEGFETSASSELRFDRFKENLAWANVLLVDLRTNVAEDFDEAALRLMGQINELQSHPPMVALCDAEQRGPFLRAVEYGADDSITNPPNINEVRVILRRVYKLYASEQELQKLRGTESAGRLHELIGTSGPMQELFAMARKIATCDVSVLITGETGTGKELLARAIHHLSGRNSGPLVAFSCANLPETLVEDELFGHEKGAFTGAIASRCGRVEAADHGTLFLDEIGDLGIGLQPKLLRVLQERRFERLGGNKTINVDLRLVCATNRNLGEMVQQGKFREDLYYRLNVVQMHLPPLRERRDDISLLAQQFLTKASHQFQKEAKSFSPAALQTLEEYNWPGNVRELENVVQRGVALSDGAAVELSNLPTSMRTIREESPESASAAAVSEGAGATSQSYEEEVRRFKRALILRTLRQCDWRKAECARTLGV